MKLINFIVSSLVASTLIQTACDNSHYKTTQIGSQIWMTENLNVSTFSNGEPIPQAKTEEEWKKAGLEKKPVWCYSKFDAANGRKYGKLYNGYAVFDSRGLAPKGWHIPNTAEWEQLINELGGKDEVADKLKATSGWDEFKGLWKSGSDGTVHKNSNGNGNNSSGFTALPGGSCDNYGTDNFRGIKGIWWSCTEDETLLYNYALDNLFSFLEKRIDHMDVGFSVRCIKD